MPQRRSVIPGLVRGIQAAHLQSHPLSLERRLHPTGRFAFFKHVSHRRQINEVNTAEVLFDFPVMGMAEDIGFDLFARTDDFEERFGIFEPINVRSLARIMMNQNQRGLVAIGVK